MAKCFVCDVEISEANRSEEHILLNCSGARLRSKGLLCVEHNSTFGGEGDAALCKQFGLIPNLLNISRDRGTPAPVKAVGTKSGTEFKLLPGGIPELAKPEVVQIRNGNEVEIKVVARSIEEAREILKGLSKKYPKMKLEDFLTAAQHKSEMLDESVQTNFSIGGPHAFQSVLKSLVGFYLHEGNNPEHVKALIPLLTNTATTQIPVGLFYDGNQMVRRSKSDVNHVIAIKGDGGSKQILGYLEYFGGYKFLALLNSGYEGPTFESTYSFDPILSEAVPAPPLDWTCAEAAMNDVLSGARQSNEAAQAALAETMKICMSTMTGNSLEQLLDREGKDWTKKYQGEEFVTEEMINDLVARIAPQAGRILFRQQDRDR